MKHKAPISYIPAEGCDGTGAQSKIPRRIRRLGAGLGPLLGCDVEIAKLKEKVARRQQPLRARQKFNQEFRRRIRQARESAGLSSTDVAHALEIPVLEYESYETSKMPHHCLLPRLCDVLQISISYLYEDRQ